MQLSFIPFLTFHFQNTLIRLLTFLLIIATYYFLTFLLPYLLLITSHSDWRLRRWNVTELSIESSLGTQVFCVTQLRLPNVLPGSGCGVTGLSAVEGLADVIPP